jgi:PAT family beta-lactamase induction signal transducer AmpG
MQLGLVIPKMISGKIQTMLGYHNFFIWVLLSALPVLLMCRFLKIKDQEPSTSENSVTKESEVGAKV